MRRRTGSEEDEGAGPKERGREEGTRKKPGSQRGVVKRGEVVAVRSGSERESGTSASDPSDSMTGERTLAVSVHRTVKLVPHVSTQKEELKTLLIEVPNFPANEVANGGRDQQGDMCHNVLS